MEQKRSVQRRELISVGAVLSLLVVIFLGGLHLRAGGKNSWLQFIEVGASALLSLSLVAVYLSQNRILRRQRRVMSAGYSPVVSVRDVSFTERDASEFPTGGQGSLQTIEIEATNRGNDIAADLELRCIVDYDTERSELLSCLKRSSSVLPVPRTTALQLEDESDGIYRDGGPALPPTMDKPATLYGHIGVDHDGRYCSIPDAIDIATEDGVDSLRLGFVLRYRDASGDTYSVLLRAYKVANPETGLEFDDIVDEPSEIPRQDLDGRIDGELQRES
jgi:hypothetical protein